ncbi:secretin and TonB N-terminal domain-containing protein [Burkholderiaceae bacterium UC74_6]
MKTRALLPLAASLLLASCANPALREAEDLSRANRLPQAVAVLDKAVQQQPGEPALRAAQMRLRDQLAQRQLLRLEGLRQTGRWDEAAAALDELRLLDPGNARLSWFDAEITRGGRQDLRLAEARRDLEQGRLDRADAAAREVLAESPRHAEARRLIARVAEKRPVDPFSYGELGPAFQKPVDLEFRDATLRQVFEALSRSSAVNFVFDRDVKGDARVTVFLKKVTLDEALRVILSTQGLDRKLLSENTVFIYPNNQNKEREHQELVTRTLYLTNADAKQVMAMAKTITKVRDVHVDERLNMLVMRDTPEVLRLVEKLVAAIDLPEPEVMLDVEVMELSSDKVDTLGLQWPSSLQLGISDAAGNIPSRVFIGGKNPSNFRASIANPVAVANLSGTDGDVNLLANPKIRVRNKDKARIQIGEKVPVFTTTTNFTGQTSVAAAVQYQDVGLKLEVEPVVQLDNDVSIKINLEVSNIINQVTGPGGTTAYQTGQRQTSTTLRLADGETQVLAGLINNEDRTSSTGVPGLQNLPLLGRLFGSRTDTRNKSEIVLLITPHVIRNLSLPDAANSRLPGGTDASPGAFSSLIRSSARSGLALAASAPTAAAPKRAVLQYEVAQAAVPVGSSASLTLRNEAEYAVKAVVEYDARMLQAAPADAAGAPGRMQVEVPAKGEKTVALRALPAAIGQVLSVGVSNAQALGVPAGESVAVQAEGVGLIHVEAR